MGVRSTGRIASAAAVVAGGATIFNGAQEPSKVLDTTVLAGLKRGDEYLVNPDSGTLSAGHLFICIDPTAGAARWQRSSAIAQVFIGPLAGAALVNNVLLMPSFCSHHALYGIGPGGGGASGSVQAAGTAAYGGNGGDGGQYLDAILSAADLGSLTSLTLRLTPPGLGGAAVTADTTAGVDGGSAVTGGILNGATSILPIIGGTKGSAGSAAAPFNFTNPGVGINWSQGGKNVASSLTTNGTVSGPTVRGGWGGAAGGCIDASNNARTGGGANSGRFTALGVNGIDGDVLLPSLPYSGTGPSGGGAALTGAAGAGGRGVDKGQGGGGGGAARNGQGGSGKGGDGAPAWFLMISRP